MRTDGFLFPFQATAAAAQANLLKQQEELERKAAALERREQELQSRGASGVQAALQQLRGCFRAAAPPFTAGTGSSPLLSWQVKRTTGLLCPRGSPSSRVSTRTSRRRSPQSTRGCVRCSTTCG